MQLTADIPTRRRAANDGSQFSSNVTYVEKPHLFDLNKIPHFNAKLVAFPNHTQPLHTRKAEHHDLSMCQACGVEKYMAQSYILVL